MVTSSPAVGADELLLEVKGSLHGEEPVAEFRREMEVALKGPYRTITLDLHDVPSINSSCIGRILLYRKELLAQGRTIRIRGCSDPLLATFRSIRFDRLVPIL